jgi:uncharacterized membrane protein
MNGGPSHIDTFDPKSGASAGPFRAIDTAQKGVQICEHLPQLAAIADRLAFVRSVTSKEGNHDRARQLMHTGYVPSLTVAHPSLGAWLSYKLGASGELPAFVSVAGPSAPAGFLGAQHGPFVQREPGKLPDDVALPVGLDGDRLDRRMRALAEMDRGFAARVRDESVRGRADVRERALKLMRSPRLDAFDLHSEPEAARKSYGDSAFGRGCLLARRLVERGVRVVEVTLDGWDTHRDNFGRCKSLMQDLDPAMAALVRDLEARDLLSSTLVVWMGEFGRTPAINDNEGRDHHPRASSVVLAGGPIRRGIVHGATDAAGNAVVDRPVTVSNLFATLAKALGLDPGESVMTPAGRPIAITDHGSAIAELLA